MVIVTLPTNIENVKAIVQRAESVESYIGHEATAKLLTELLGREVPMNRSEYVPEVGDIAIVVRLKRRLATPQDVKDVKVEDLEFHIVNYNNDWVLGWE
jgi:sporulation protein YlmC with PRC-barrel domain